MTMYSAKHDVKLKTKITFENKAVLHVQYLNRDLRQYFTPEKCYCGGFSTNTEYQYFKSVICCLMPMQLNLYWNNP